MENNNNYHQIVPLTFQEKVEMYLKLDKLELAKMLASRDEIETMLRTEKHNVEFGKCKSWSDCTNPCYDCINCPLRLTDGGITTSASTLNK